MRISDWSSDVCSSDLPPARCSAASTSAATCRRRRARATEIAVEVRDALARGIDRNTWMGTEARAEAKAKLANLKIEVGAPVRDLDFSVQPMGPGSFGSKMLIASTRRHRTEMKRISPGNASRAWTVTTHHPTTPYHT